MTLIIVLIIGLSGIVAQAVLLRELLVSYCGNELTLGIILANWLVSAALGAFVLGRYVEKARNKFNALAELELILVFVLPLAVYFSRTFKGIIGVLPGEALGLDVIFWSSFLLVFPVAFCQGGLFSAACKLLSGPGFAIGKVYALETAGAIIGGFIFTYIFLARLNSFGIVFIIVVLSLLISFAFFNRISKLLRSTAIIIALVLILFFLANGVNRLHDFSIRRQWQGGQVLAYRNSIYGNIVVTEKQGQKTFFYNGLPLVTVPYPDITFVEEFGNLPLLFHPRPREILVVSAGAGGLINEILKHPVAKVDYVELDPLIIEMLKTYPSDLTRRELGDKRVSVINSDGRFFVRETSGKYDLVLIGLSKPADLAVNRLFSLEFFKLAKLRMHQDGILALSLPGSLTYLSRELKEVNSCIINALKGTYAYLRIIPGDYNIVLASDSAAILEVNPAVVTQRLGERGVKISAFSPTYLGYRLSPEHLDWFSRQMQDTTTEINQDLRPSAVFKMLVFWNKEFSPSLSGMLGVLGKLNLKAVLLVIIFLTLVLFYPARHSKNLALGYSIFTTGFFGMLTSLVLIFAYQVYWGYLYYKIGLLISIFMAGTALASGFITARLARIKNDSGLLVKLEAGIAGFSCFLALVLTSFMKGSFGPEWLFGVLFFSSGALVGLEFPLASKIYLAKNNSVGKAAGLIYALDLLGGWFAGMLGAVALVPVLGVFGACMVVVMLKLSSLSLLTAGFLLKK